VVVHEDRDRTRVLVHQPIPTPPVYSSWESPYSTSYVVQPQAVSLLSGASLVNRVQTETGSRLAGETTLRLTAAGSGSTYIQNITLNYFGGGSQLVTVNRTLDASKPTFEIPGVQGGMYSRCTVGPTRRVIEIQDAAGDPCCRPRAFRATTGRP
jgi:hypothetical protein